jgi:hypothetical protein
VGAFKSTLPSGVRGTCFQGYGCHCPWAATAKVSAKATPAVRMRGAFLRFIFFAPTEANRPTHFPRPINGPPDSGLIVNFSTATPITVPHVYRSDEISLDEAARIAI